MLSRERVIEVIEHRQPDRIPVYGWVKANLEPPISARFGSVDNFEDHYEFDFAHLFGGPNPYPEKVLDELRTAGGGIIEPDAVLEIQLADPNEMSAYQEIKDAIFHHKDQRARFIYMQTPGIFECLNGVFGIENHLMNLALFEPELHEIYHRQAEWNRTFANNCIDLGVDMVHVSDDWGAQNGLMFSPATWWRMIYPYHKITCDAVKQRQTYISLHSDGNISQVLDGVLDLGFNVVHPYQESAGMDLAAFKKHYSQKFSVMGGLDVQTTIGFGDYARLETEIRRVLEMFCDGGLLFCTTHFVQDHCTIDELTFAYDLVYRLVREG